jgi:hypothetical protein
MGPHIYLHRRFLIGVFLALSTVCRSVHGGPDHAILPACVELYKSLRPELRHSVRDLVQDLQAIESYLAHLRLGRPLPQSSVPSQSPTTIQLEDWKARNTSSLQHMLGRAEVAQRLSIRCGERISAHLPPPPPHVALQHLPRSIDNSRIRGTRSYLDAGPAAHAWTPGHVAPLSTMHRRRAFPQPPSRITAVNAAPT